MCVTGQEAFDMSHLHMRMFVIQQCVWFITNDGRKLPQYWSSCNMPTQIWTHRISCV